MAYLLRYCHCIRVLPPEKNTNYQYWKTDVFGHYLEFYHLLFDQPHSSIVSRMLNKEEFSKHFQSNPNTFLENKYLWLDTVLRAARGCLWHTTLGNVNRISTFSLSVSSKNIIFRVRLTEANISDVFGFPSVYVLVYSCIINETNFQENPSQFSGLSDKEIIPTYTK